MKVIESTFMPNKQKIWSKVFNFASLKPEIPVISQLKAKLPPAILFSCFLICLSRPLRLLKPQTNQICYPSPPKFLRASLQCYQHLRLPELPKIRMHFLTSRLPQKAQLLRRVKNRECLPQNRRNYRLHRSGWSKVLSVFHCQISRA